MTDRRDRTDADDERTLDAIVDGADRAADDDVRRHVPPPFAAIVARAHRIDPQAIPVAAIDRSASRGPPRRTTPAVSAPRNDDDELAVFTAAARAEAEHDVAVREDDGIPAFTRPAPTRRYAALFMVAAAAAIALVTAQALQGWRADARRGSREASQALAGVDTTPEIHEASHGEPTPVPRRSPDAGERRPAPTPIEPATFVVPEEPAPLERDAIDPPEVARGSLARVPLDDALARLEDRAEAALARGRRDLADRSYAEIIRRGGRHPRVELAFADRFVLAREAALGERRALWSAYLERFPHGRFADDARAGLCRTASAADKRGCWRAYVGDFPSGTHRSLADRWIAAADGASDEP